MTEAEWLATADPRPMLEFLRGRASRRKLQLFGVACYCQELPEQAALVRDLIGNPFRPATLTGPYRTPGVAGMAESIYAEGRFEELPVLADALEDAGCADADILSHLRGPGPHVRGCWALDLCLGKS